MIIRKVAVLHGGAKSIPFSIETISKDNTRPVEVTVLLEPQEVEDFIKFKNSLLTKDE